MSYTTVRTQPGLADRDLSNFLVMLDSRQNQMSGLKSWGVSIGVHLGSIVLVWLLLFLIQFFNLDWFTFKPPERLSDIEFQLVQAPDEKPRNPNTRNRSDRNTRAGGTKIPNVREAQPMQQMGGKTKATAKAPPQPPAKPKPTPRTVTPKAVERPTPKPVQKAPPTPTRPKKIEIQRQPETPAPPRPKVTAPQAVQQPSKAPPPPPRPLAAIKVPDAPSAVATGPIVRGPISSTGSSGNRPNDSSSSGGGASGRPSTLPGQFAPSGGGGGSGRPSAGGMTGDGGRGTFSQAGSPGGGGGRPGIDSTASVDFGPYMAELKRRIRKFWQPPGSPRRQDGCGEV